MKKMLVTAAIAALLAGTTGTAFAARTAQDLWPSQMGNTWTYEFKSQITSGTSETKVLETSGGWTRIDGFEGNQWWWISSQSGRVYVWNASAGTYHLVFDLAKPKGSTWQMDFPGAACLDKTTWLVLDDDSTVETPVGTFQGCVILVLQRSACADAGLGEVVFAPGVGIVRTSSQSIAGPVESNLVHALVNGTEYRRRPPAAAKGLTACVTADKHVYELWDNRMPSPTPRPQTLRPDTMVVDFVIANDTAETITFDYRSGQKYDFVIRDEKGREVYRWSQGRFFTMALQRDILLPGQSLRFSEKIVLVTAAGTPIPAERFTVEAIHTTNPNGHRMKAKAPFKIELRIAY